MKSTLYFICFITLLVASCKNQTHSSSRVNSKNSFEQDIEDSFSSSKSKKELIVNVTLTPRNNIEQAILDSFPSVKENDIESALVSFVATVIKESGESPESFKNADLVFNYPEVKKNGIPVELEFIEKYVPKGLWDGVNNLIERYSEDGAKKARADILKLALERSNIDREGNVRTFVEKYNIWPSGNLNLTDPFKAEVSVSFDF